MKQYKEIESMLEELYALEQKNQEVYGYVDEELEEDICYYEYMLEEAKRSRASTSIIGFDCLLDEVFTYDMGTAHSQPKTLRDKWAMFEPDVFDVDVSAEQLRQWILE